MPGCHFDDRSVSPSAMLHDVNCRATCCSGAVYFAEEMLATRGDSAGGKVAAVSGSGNVAQYTTEKLLQLGAKVITMSDSGGTIVDKNGIDEEKLAWSTGPEKRTPRPHS